MKLSLKSKRRIRKVIFSLSYIALAGFVVLLFCNHHVTSVAANKSYDKAGEVPVTHVALVLGCSPRLADGRENFFFRYRMDAAAELFFQHRTEVLLVSGDNRFYNYDEPTEMKSALIARGVPEKRIVCDFAGRRTLDSVLRARDIFGQSSFIIVSQPFHNIRALYIAEKSGIHAVAYNARDIPAGTALPTYIRESLARTKAVLDVEVFGVKPQVMGDPVAIPTL